MPMIWLAANLSEVRVDNKQNNFWPMDTIFGILQLHTSSVKNNHTFPS